MSDFFKIDTRPGKRGVTEIYPKFIVGKPNDLMIRGSDFYAIWMEERGLWSTDEQDVIRTIDRELRIYADEYQKTHNNGFHVLYMWDAESGMIDNWHKYCQRQMRDNFHPLDEVLIFSNTPVKKESYASKRLPYPLEPGSINAYHELMGVLYSPEEREKLEWAIGAVVNGASKEVQKFIVLYGDPGSGKSTVLNIVQKLFEGYCGVFDSRALGSSSNAFALEAFKSNPLVSIQHDGDLSRIEDNTRLNSLVSHETMLVNEKFKSQYPTRFNCFLFLGTNKAVKITDAKSGLIRRLIDVTPTGNKLPAKKYLDLVHKVNFELGGIAWHCKEVYEANPRQYDDYIPTRMLGASNDFYNFMLDSFYIFKKEDGVSLKRAWAMYKDYNAETNVQYPYSRRAFREELMNYFSDYKEREADVNGERVRATTVVSRWTSSLSLQTQNLRKREYLSRLLHHGSSSKSSTRFWMIFARDALHNMPMRTEPQPINGKMSARRCPTLIRRGFITCGFRRSISSSTLIFRDRMERNALRKILKLHPNGPGLMRS